MGDEYAVAKDLVYRYGSAALVAVDRLIAVARERHRADALLTLLRAKTWVEMLLRR